MLPLNTGKAISLLLGLILGIAMNPLSVQDIFTLQ